MRRREQQSGISTIAILVVILAIGIVGAAGLLVYQHNRTKLSSPTDGAQTTNQNNNQQSNTNPTTTITHDTNTNTFTIPELNAMMTLPDGLTRTDLKYSISTDTGVPVAGFTTASLEQADGKSSCSASQAPIGVIWRTTQNPASGSVAVKQMGRYYYAFQKPQGSCTGNVNAGKLEQSQTTLLQQAFQTTTTIN